MRFADEYPSFYDELDSFYRTYPWDVSAAIAVAEQISAAHPEWGPCRRKAITYEVAAAECEAHVFRHSPFYFELVTGLDRQSWGSLNPSSGDLGSWFMNQEPHVALRNKATEALRPARELQLATGPAVLDLDHHCVGYDTVLEQGLSGIIRHAKARLEEPAGASSPGMDFLSAVVVGNLALISIARRFADKAEQMAGVEQSPFIRKRLERIADTARRIPAEPARTFYEALCAILFMRHVLAGLEGIGESILGHLDRMLGPYLEADLAAGRITEEEAADLTQSFLAITDVKFNIREEPRETSTTVVIGGCDRAGAPVYNRVTRLIIDGYRRLRLVNPKLNARVSPDHDADFLARLGELTVEGRNVLAVYNDPVLIEANVRAGKALEDCRLYVGGGCQENVLQNTEINSRASIYLNLPQVLLMGFDPAPWREVTDAAGLRIRTYADVGSFDDLREAFLENLSAITNHLIDQRNATEAEGWWYNPCPLHSSTLAGCIENGRDMMAGGTRYAGASVSLIGGGTVVDSLRAIRDLVFEEGRAGIAEIAAHLEQNFHNAEPLRRYILNRIPKYGMDDPEMALFAAELFADLARVTSGRPNTRGGRYEASLFVYRAFVGMGAATGATPDGRKSGEPFSPGMSPGPVGMHRGGSIPAVLKAVRCLDLAAYPVAAVLDLQLPWSTSGAGSPEMVATVFRRFMAAGGSVLQLNVADPEALKDARLHPERHGDIVVRVSGYSARFTTLPDRIQDEIIAREVASV